MLETGTLSGTYRVSPLPANRCRGRFLRRFPRETTLLLPKHTVRPSVGINYENIVILNET